MRRKSLIAQQLRVTIGGISDAERCQGVMSARTA
jgi:hypothetical protein